MHHESAIDVEDISLAELQTYKNSLGLYSAASQQVAMRNLPWFCRFQQNLTNHANERLSTGLTFDI